ncbi:penicillin-binding protein 2 [bacterium]|nr:penicillin-binding protein 2 [bacterium]
MAAHLFFLQFDATISEHYKDSVAKRWESYEYPQGKRGTIMFRDGSVAACNRKVALLLVDPTLVGDLEAVAQTIAGYVGADPAVIAEKVRNHTGRGVEVARSIPLTTALALDHENMRGVFTRYYYERYYPHGSFGAATTIGYAGPEPVHRTGLEYTWDGSLSGQNGEIHYRKDANRKRLPGSEISANEKQDGQDLVTTLDQAIQLVCEDELRQAVTGHSPEWGCILVLEPDSGEVIANATFPSYDPNEYARGNIGDEFNVSVHRIIEPGSTVKPLLAAYAIDQGWLNPERRFVCNRALTIDGKPLREANPNHIVGDGAGVPVSEIIIHSSNIGMAQVALSLGQSRVLDAYSSMGFFQRTGIELPCECAGLQPYYYAQRNSDKPVSWPRRVVANAGFGQGLSVTPLQMARAYCIIANGGFLVQPTLIMPVEQSADQPVADEELKLPEGEILLAGLGADTAPWVEEQIIINSRNMQPAFDNRVRVLSEETCQLVTKWLVQVVEQGTGKSARLERYAAAGKTGTGQIASEDGGYRKGAYSASFAGFFPAESPRYVVYVMLVHPRDGGYYGGEVAAPVFKGVCDRISYLDHLLPGEATDEAR